MCVCFLFQMSIVTETIIWLSLCLKSLITCDWWSCHRKTKIHTFVVKSLYSHCLIVNVPNQRPLNFDIKNKVFLELIFNFFARFKRLILNVVKIFGKTFVLFNFLLEAFTMKLRAVAFFFFLCVHAPPFYGR